MNQIVIPTTLRKSCGGHPEGAAWLAELPILIRELVRRWSLRLGPPFDAEASCSWVAPCLRADGSSAVLKIGWPHMEAEHEIAGLRFWAGEPTIFVLEADEAPNAMLLERCVPGTVLRTQPEDEQDRIIAALLRRLWRTPPQPHPFRPLSEMTALWSEEALEHADGRADLGLLREGLRIFCDLSRSSADDVLLATDLHAGNVLRSQREPWLVIDPKPFVGDPAYDATQHLLNCMERLRLNPLTTIKHFSDLLEVDRERVRLWLFARLVIENWEDGRDAVGLAKRLAP